MRWLSLGAALAVLIAIVYFLLLVLPEFDAVARNKDLAGGLIGAAGTIFAALIAWAALTTQIKEQKTSTQIAERTYWQSQRGSAETIVYGLKLTLRSAHKLRDAYKKRDTTTACPEVDGLKLIQKTGVLDQSSFPPTGNELFAWDFNIHLTTLRIWWHRVGAGQNAQDLPEARKVIGEAVDACTSLIDDMGRALAKAKDDVARADLTLQQLDRFNN